MKKKKLNPNPNPNPRKNEKKIDLLNKLILIDDRKIKYKI